MLDLRTLLTGPGEANPDERPFLVVYEYTEDDKTRRYGFLTHAQNPRAAAEQFWGQHPGEWFHLISVNDGSIELFWVRRLEKFVTIPEGD